MNKKLKYSFIGALSVSALFLASCESSSESSTASDDSFTIYTSVPQDLIDEFTEAYQEKNPDKNIEVFRAASGDLLSKLRTEHEADSVEADVVWVADFQSAESLKDLDILEQYEPAEADMINDNLIDPEGYYYGSRIINMVLAYNTDVETPSSWHDLINSEYEGSVGIPSVSSGTSFNFVGTLVADEDFGWEFFEDMRDNGANQYSNNSDVAERVATGELSIAPVLDYMVRNMQEQGSPIDFVVPEEGLVMVASPIALVKDSDSPESAQSFIDFTLSQEGQEIMGAQNVVPIRDDVDVPESVPSIDDVNIFETDLDYLNENAEEITSQFENIFTN